LTRRMVGYVLIFVAVTLVIVAWIRSFPLHLQPNGNYLFDSTDPLFWIGISLGNVALFLIASGSRSRLERFTCAFAFIVLTCSIKFFFTYLEGVDSDLFRGLTENFAASGVQNVYYRWPLLFILGTGVSEVTGQSVQIVAGVLFLAWTLILAGGIFSYTDERNNVMDFLAPIAYIIAVYPYFPWQFSAQTMALAFSVICIVLLLKEGTQFRILVLLLYITIVFSHAFFGVFLALAVCVMAFRNRKYLTLAFAMITTYTLGFFFNVDWTVQAALSEYANLFRDYHDVNNQVLAIPFSTLDALGQTISRVLTVSMWGLLAVAVISLILSKRTRRIDVSLTVSGSVYAVVGVYGWRAFQILLLPTLHAFKSLLLKGRARKVVLAYFFVALAVFPFAMIHKYYNDTAYMTVAEQHAVDNVLVATYGGHANPNFRMMIRERTRAYLDSKTKTGIDYVNEYKRSQILMGSGWFRLIFMSPEFEKDMTTAGSLSPQEVSRFEQGMHEFSRVYSNGQVTVFANTNATSPGG
jgi:hypothetical protein